MPLCHSNGDIFFPSLVTYLIHPVTRLQGRNVNTGVRACLYAYVYAAVHLCKLLVSESVFGCIRTASCPEAPNVVSEKDLKCYLALSQEQIPYHLSDATAWAPSTRNYFSTAFLSFWWAPGATTVGIFHRENVSHLTPYLRLMEESSASCPTGRTESSERKQNHSSCKTLTK